MIQNFWPVRLLLLALAGLVTTPAMAEGPTEGPTTLSETYDAWTVQCVRTQAGEVAQRLCQASQDLLQQETRQRVLTIAFGVTGAGTRATLVLPFGLLLSEGFRVQVGDEQILHGAYRTCLPAGCVAEIDISEDVIRKLEAAEAASVLMTANSGQQVKTDVSFKGFPLAYRRLVELTLDAEK